MFPQHTKQCSRYKHSHIRNIGAEVITYETQSRVVNKCERLLGRSVLKNEPEVKHSHSNVSMFSGCCSHVSTAVLLTVYGHVYVMHQWDKGVGGQKLNESSIRIHYVILHFEKHYILWIVLWTMYRFVWMNWLDPNSVYMTTRLTVVFNISLQVAGLSWCFCEITSCQSSQSKNFSFMIDVVSTSTSYRSSYIS